MGQEMLNHNAAAASVILPCFNAEHTLGEQLDALAEQTGGIRFEVLIVDNRSTDGTVELAKQYAERFFRLRIIPADEKPGAGYARNVGAAAAGSNKLLFCDADDRVSAGWVKAMSEALDKAKLVGGGRDFEHLNAVWHPHVRTTKSNASAQRICDVHSFGKAKIPNVGAGNLAVNRDFFLELGGFDEGLRVHEDVDFFVRVWLSAGHQLQLCPEGLVYIRVQQTMASLFRQARSWGYWEVALLKKHRKLLGWKQVVQSLQQWKALIYSLFGLQRENGSKQFLYLLGWKCGRILGSFRFMVFAP